jgi:hypothetical protein
MTDDTVPMSDFAALVVKYRLSQEALAVAHEQRAKADLDRIEALEECLTCAFEIATNKTEDLGKARRIEMLRERYARLFPRTGGSRYSDSLHKS